MKIYFNNYNKDNWGDLQQKVSDTLVNSLKQDKSFYIEFYESKEPKTHEQLKAIYKLFQKALPYFQEDMPNEKWDLDKIKEFSKTELGFIRDSNDFEVNIMIKNCSFKPRSDEEAKRMFNFCKKIKQNLSFADFTKEQLMNFIKEFEIYCQERGWNNVFLQNNN